MITNGDYQSAKRWLIENLESQTWYTEHEPAVKRRGRKGVICRFGNLSESVENLQWGNKT
jgi:hypothetical protein